MHHPKVARGTLARMCGCRLEGGKILHALIQRTFWLDAGIQYFGRRHLSTLHHVRVAALLHPTTLTRSK
eukprot:scaffold273600_cov36-Tisochrysis_lutea.AAC.1